MFLSVLFIFFAYLAKAQNIGINATGATPNTSAGLDIDFTNKGLLIPRIALTSTTDITTIASPATSSLVYNTNAGITSGSGAGYYYFDGTKWVRLFDSNLPIKAWELLGNAGTTAGTNFLGTTDAQDLVFRTANAERMRILSSGFVGIGTSTPSARLNIDPQGAGGIVIGNSNTGAGGFTSLLMGISANTGGYATIDAIKASGSLSGDIILNGGNGNVGIGTGVTAPAYKLEVKGSLGVVTGSANNTFSVQEINETASGFGNLTSIVTGVQRGILIKDRPSLQGGLWLLGGDASANNSIGGIGMGWIGDLQSMRTSIANPATMVFDRGDIRFHTDNAKTPGTNYFYATDFNNNERMRILSTGNVGIGTGAPINMLQVAGDTRIGVVNAPFSGGYPSEGARLYLSGGTSGNGFDSDNSDPIFLVRRNVSSDQTETCLNLGDDCTSDAFIIQAGGNPFFCASTTYFRFETPGNAFKPGGGSWAAISDRRLKKNISEFKDGLNVLKSISPVWYEYNGLNKTPDGGKRYVGVIAQDLQKIAPYMVNPLYDNKEYLSVDPSAMTYITINAIQEQQTIIEKQQKQISDLEKRLEKQEKLLEELLKRK